MRVQLHCCKLYQSCDVVMSVIMSDFRPVRSNVANSSAYVLLIPLMPGGALLRALKFSWFGHQLALAATAACCVWNGHLLMLGDADIIEMQ